MQVSGEIHNVEVDIHVDGEDIANDIDWSNHIDQPVAQCVEGLLDEYDGNNSPCSLGTSFEQAVWWAMSRKEEHCSEISVMKLEDSEELKAQIRSAVRSELRELVTHTTIELGL